MEFGAALAAQHTSGDKTGGEGGRLSESLRDTNKRPSLCFHT